MRFFKWFFGLFSRKPTTPTLVCMRQAETWRWPSYLGERTPGECAECKAAIFFEVQNKDFQNL